MNWNDPLDNYCERLAPGLWAEPLNAISNAGFFLAAAALWFTMRQRGSGQHKAPASLHTLAILLVLIGLGSLAFHTFANRWSVLLDVGFIAIFIHFYVVCYLRWLWGIPWRWAWLGVPAYLVFGQAISLTLGQLIGAGGGQYLPALVGMVVFGVALSWSQDPAVPAYRTWFGLAAVLFAVSLFLRTVDGSICTDFSIGTHFLWHICNSVVLFLVSYAIVLRWREISR